MMPTLTYNGHPLTLRMPPNRGGAGAVGPDPAAPPASPEPPEEPPPAYTLSCAVQESHGQPIYCVAFSPHLYAREGADAPPAACFATCGGPFATVYEATGGGGGDPTRLAARQVYRDVDDGEAFHACAFGGRGSGSAAGVVAAEGGGVIPLGGKPHGAFAAPRGRTPKRRRRDRRPASLGGDGPPFLCLAGVRGVVKVVDTVRRRLALTLSGHGHRITDLKVSPADGELLLSASKDESVRLWNLRTGTNVAAFLGHAGHRAQVLGAAWHLDGTRFASCGMDNAVKLWRVRRDGCGDDWGGAGAPPVERALRRSYAVALPEDDGEGDDDGPVPTQRFPTVFEQFPYFSTTEVHTNYVGETRTRGGRVGAPAAAAA